MTLTKSLKYLQTNFPTQSGTQMSSSSILAINNDIVSGSTTLISINQLFDYEDGKFWVVASVVAVENVGGWYYMGCFKCFKKLMTDGDKYCCDKYKITNCKVVPRFKLELRVYDYSGNACFLMWERQCASLIGKSVVDLVAACEKKVDVDKKTDFLEEGLSTDLTVAGKKRRLLYLRNLSLLRKVLLQML